MRIYVGGVGPSVQEDDLKKTFTSPLLGDVNSVEIIRTKGRSFAYLEFDPASEKGLAKLFSTYNGCMWKGARLRLEKAKEDFITRLRHEWAQDAELKMNLTRKADHEDQNAQELKKPIKDHDLKNMQLKMFFPRVKMMKSLPFKGTGKHKYSFQRVDIPPLAIHFCDCEEHCEPLELDKRSCTDDHETDTYGVNKDELNMMKSILNKLLEKENCSSPNPGGAQFTNQVHGAVVSADNSELGGNVEDPVSDEDDLVINVASHTSKRVDPLDDWERKTMAGNQVTLMSKPESVNRYHPKPHASKKAKLLPENKKQSALENNSNYRVSPQGKARNKSLDKHGDVAIAVDAQPADTEKGSILINGDVGGSHKVAWKALVRESVNTDFHISDFLKDHTPEVETRPKFNHQATECRARKKANLLPESKKRSTMENNYSYNISPQGKAKGKVPDKHGDDDAAVNTQAADTETGSILVSSDVGGSHEVPWKAPVRESANAAFHSDILVDHTPEGEPKPKSERQATLSGCNEKYSHEDLSNRGKELEKTSDLQSNEPSASVDKSARGTSWLHKSSWLELIGDTTSSTFSITQIVPGLNLEKQDSSHFGFSDMSSSRNDKQEKSAEKHQTSTTTDIDAPLGRADKDAHDASAKPNNKVLVRSDTGSHAEETSADLKPSAEKKDGRPASATITNLIESNRAIGDIVVSETCPFMRSAASMKEWAKAKAALSSSHKRKSKGLEQ